MENKSKVLSPIILELKKYMDTNGLTQHQISVEMYCQIGSLNRWLKGGKPSASWSMLIKNYLDKKGIDKPNVSY